MSIDKRPGSRSTGRDIEQLFAAVQAGQVRHRDGRFWRDVKGGYGPMKSNQVRCDVGIRILQEQERITVQDDGTVVPR